MLLDVLLGVDHIWILEVLLIGVESLVGVIVPLFLHDNSRLIVGQVVIGGFLVTIVVLISHFFEFLLHVLVLPLLVEVLSVGIAFVDVVSSFVVDGVLRVVHFLNLKTESKYIIRLLFTDVEFIIQTQIIRSSSTLTQI